MPSTRLAIMAHPASLASGMIRGEGSLCEAMVDMKAIGDESTFCVKADRWNIFQEIRLNRSVAERLDRRSPKQFHYLKSSKVSGHGLLG
jgi:hypothetical protein